MNGIHRVFNGVSRQIRDQAEISAAILLSILVVGCAQIQTADSQATPSPASINEETPVWDLLIRLGEGAPEHRITDRSPEWVNAGRELVFEGSSVNPDSGIAGTRLSSNFRCIDCHSTRPEQASILQVGNPETKLSYAIQHDLPLLPGSSFAGLVNHDSYYNGDYRKKYRFSPVFIAAQQHLKKAVEFCSRECSRGRDPEPWELKAMLAYLWSLEWRLGDVGYTGANLDDLKRRVSNSAEHSGVASEIKSRYSLTNPATFGEVPRDPKAGYPMVRPADMQSGREIWSRSCLHCHVVGGSALPFIEDDPNTWKSLDARFDVQIYHFIREGTEHGKGKRPYMPNFTRERLSDEQIEHLKAYIRSRSQSG